MKRIILLGCLMMFGTQVYAGVSTVANRTTIAGSVLEITNSRTGAGQKDTTTVSLADAKFSILAHQTAASSVVILPMTIFVQGGGDSVQFGVQESQDGTNWVAAGAFASLIEGYSAKVLVNQPRFVRVILGNDLSSSGSTACKAFVAFPKKNYTSGP